MQRNRAAVITTVSTMMLGAGWVAGVVGTAVASTGGSTTIDAMGTGGSLATTVAPTATPSSTASAAPSATPGSTATAAATPTAAPVPVETTPAGVTGVFDGAVVDTRYGSYQAEMTVEANTITDIVMLQTGASDGTSREITGYALPQLISAVLQNQTYDVGYVSGASYTSQGFMASVQDAMVQAGLA